MKTLERLKRKDLLRVVVMSGIAFDKRAFDGDLALALGLGVSASWGWYLALDALAIVLTSMLMAQGISRKLAALIVREMWELWTPALMAIEDDPRTQAGTIIPPSQQLFLAAAPKVGARPIAVVGTMAECMTQLDALTAAEGDYLPPVGVSLCAALHAVRSNGKRFEVQLPQRFSISRTDLRFPAWRREIDDYRKAAAMRARAKARAKRARPQRELA